MNVTHKGEGQKEHTPHPTLPLSLLPFHFQLFCVSFSDGHVETQHASVFSALADAPLLPTSPLKSAKNHIRVAEKKGATAPRVPALLPQSA